MTEAYQPVPEAAEPSPPAATPSHVKPDRPWTRAWAQPWLRPLIVIAAILAALSLIVTLVVVVDLKSTSSYTAGSPEATVMSWTTAVKSGDYATADTYLTSNLKWRGTTSRSIAYVPQYAMETAEFSIVSSSTQGTTATVVVQVKVKSGGMSSTLSTQLTMLLVRENGEWKIDYVRPQTTN